MSNKTIDTVRGSCLHFSVTWPDAEDFTPATVIEAFDASNPVLEEIEFTQAPGGFDGFLPEEKVAALTVGAINRFRIRVVVAPSDCPTTTPRIPLRVV